MDQEVDGMSARRMLLAAPAAIRVLAAAVFLGWLMIWIVAPTNTYWNVWHPKLIADTDSTYLGTQGTNILIYTFPVLFIAVLGCVYLHLVKVTGRHRNQISTTGGGGRRGCPCRLASWKRPALVSGPLGIVSWTELAFAAMFLALLIWCFASFLTVGFAYITPQSAAESGQKVYVAGEAAKRRPPAGPSRQHLLRLPLLPRHPGLLAPAARRPHVGGQHQVPHLAWPHRHGPLHRSRPVLPPILGFHQLPLLHAGVGQDGSVERGGGAGAALRVGAVGDDLPGGEAQGLRGVLLHAPALRALPGLLPPARRHLLLLPHPPRDLPLPPRPLPALPAVAPARAPGLRPPPPRRHHRAQLLQEPRWQAKLQSAALRLGLLGNICCAFLFFPVTRGSSLLPLVGLTSEGSIKYHIWLGHTVMVLFTAHGLCYVLFWASTNSLSFMLEWAKTGVSNVAGELALLCGLALWVTTFPAVRRKAFEVFFYTHQLYALFLVFFLLHVGISFFCLILPGIYLFLLDRFLRFLQSRQHVRLVSARLLPGDTVELNFSKSPGLEYNPLSVVFINFPALSKMQWHPFTVTSNSNLEPDRLSVVVKKEGSWSKKLYQVLSSPSSLDRLDVSLEGPYEPASNDFLSYDSLVMVSGGSGITPFFSIIRELLFRSAAGGVSHSTPTIHLICAFKTSADLTMLDLLLPISSDDASGISRLQLRIDAFVTREKAAAPAVDSGKHIRTVWFKPRPSDLPVSAALGPRSWLWLAAVISASFAAFLLLLGVLNRYYIYPIDNNTNMVYSYSARALLNLLLLCGCLGAAAAAAFLWNKRAAAYSVDARQVQSMDGPTPGASPDQSWSYNTDRELESYPQESLVRSTNVQFGTRPDLKKMLLELQDGPSTGVLVSGPREMRREVAGICSSGLAQNLHFESMSFSW